MQNYWCAEVEKLELMSTSEFDSCFQPNARSGFQSVTRAVLVIVLMIEVRLLSQ